MLELQNSIPYSTTCLRAKFTRALGVSSCNLRHFDGVLKRKTQCEPHQQHGGTPFLGYYSMGLDEKFYNLWRDDLHEVISECPDLLLLFLNVFRSWWMSRSHLFWFFGVFSCSRFIAGQVRSRVDYYYDCNVCCWYVVLPFLDVRKLSSLGTYWMSYTSVVLGKMVRSRFNR